MTTWLADTSVAVPFVQSAHAAHQRVRSALDGRRVGLPAHAAIETYSVLTRLPGDARLTPQDASTVIGERFTRVAALDPAHQHHLVAEFAAAKIAGGAVYDALIALTARHDRSTLLTRDSRAATTYQALGAEFEVIA